MEYRLIHAPGFETAHGWFNVKRPLTSEDLRGKIVLLDFWSYCCINCLHLIPELRRLEERYEDQLVVLGIHSAKYRNERSDENIRQAILRQRIRHPVANDRDFRIWRSYDVHAWPTLVLIDEEGYVLERWAGEGHGEGIEEGIRGAIALARRRGTLKEGPFPLSAPERAEQPGFLSFPGKVLFDEPSERLFVADTGHDRIVIARPDGKVLDVAGSGKAGAADGKFEEASFRGPQGMALSEEGLWVAEPENHLIRRLDFARRTVETVAGMGHQAPWGSTGGPALRTPLNSPWDLAARGQDLFVAMAGAHQIWRFSNGWLEPYAGSGQEEIFDAPRARAALAQPSGLTTDGKELFFADSETSSIRRIGESDERVTTLVGQGLFVFGDQDGIGEAVRLQHPLGVSFMGGRLFLADTYNHKIKRLDPLSRRVETLCGSGKPGYADGKEGAFWEPGGLSAGTNRIFVADTNNHALRSVDPETGFVSTLFLR